MKKETTDSYTLLFILLGVCFIAWLTWPFIVDHWIAQGAEEKGQFGDLYGGINALFTAVAFAGVIYTVLQQKTELRLQRDELELTRKELRGQKEVMQRQVDNLEVQSFEGTFFQMLRLHNDILNTFDINLGNRKLNIIETGRDCLKQILEKMSFNGSLKDISQLKREIEQEYGRIWKTYNGELGIYFRSLYTLVKFVDQSDSANKKLYTNIIRAQLSEQELILILYNCLWLKESKFTPLVMKYELLKHLPVDQELRDHFLKYQDVEPVK